MISMIVLGGIQRCSKRSVDITCLQMQAAGFDKCKAGKPANPDICSAQIQMHDFDKSMRARHADVIFVTWQMHICQNVPLSRSSLTLQRCGGPLVVYWWCIGSAIPINDFIDHKYQNYDAG